MMQTPHILNLYCMHLLVTQHLTTTAKNVCCSLHSPHTPRVAIYRNTVGITASELEKT